MHVMVKPMCVHCLSLLLVIVNTDVQLLQNEQKIQWNNMCKHSSLVFRFYKIQHQPGLHPGLCWEAYNILATMIYITFNVKETE